MGIQATGSASANVSAGGAPANIAASLIAAHSNRGGVDIAALAVAVRERGGSDPAASAQLRADVEARLSPVDRGGFEREIAEPAGSTEGIGSFVEGAIKGDFSDNDSWSKTAGQVAMGFVPIAGQIADARDTAAALGQIARGESGGWLNLGASAIGWVPGIGDAAKAAIRGGEHVVEGGGRVAATVARHGDEAAAATGKAGKQAEKTIVADGGSKGDWSKELNARDLKPDATYKVNGYAYRTDAQGRVTHVEGTLDLKTAERNGYQQQVSGRGDRLPDDQGGHLIASIFNGPGDRLNLVPMNGNLNTGAWKALENKFAAALKDGKQVDLKTEVIYAEGSKRPEAFSVQYVIDGKTTTEFFKNVPGGK